MDSQETVRFVQDRRNQFLGTVVSVFLAGGFWLWFRSGQMEAAFGVIFSAFLSFEAWRRLDPERCFLQIGPDGIEEHRPIGRALTCPWLEIELFEVIRDRNGIEIVGFRHRFFGASQGHFVKLADTYGYQPQEFVQLLNRQLTRKSVKSLSESGDPT